MKKYTVIGIMSGTSLDGLDIALCQFSRTREKWKFRILNATTIFYTAAWKEKLATADRLSGPELISLDFEYGRFLGQCVNEFLKGKKDYPDFIASHGHTLFHQPEKNYTLQIGNGASLAAVSGLTTICDFRAVDVALGGQGAPLVPAGDEFLFPEYDYCLNLGGIGNISCRKTGKRVAFDICPVNMAINHLMDKINLEMDEDGALGRSGTVIPELLVKLNDLEFYKSSGPKSLGREWFEAAFLPVVEKFDMPLRDLLRTVYEHIAMQVSKTIGGNTGQSVLVTGGGTHNSFLIERLKNNSTAHYILPDNLIIDYKEALVFAFLGVLRMRNEINCFASVTGASRDNIGGKIFYGLQSDI